MRAARGPVFCETCESKVERDINQRGQLRRRYCSDKCRERRNHLKQNFGLSPAEYRALLAAQKGMCGGCGLALIDPLFSPHVDHDRRTGVVRGLLHGSCNVALGCIDDSISKLEGLIDYLRDPPAPRAGLTFFGRRTYELTGKHFGRNTTPRRADQEAA